MFSDPVLFGLGRVCPGLPLFEIYPEDCSDVPQAAGS
jgi:hypothetical protein